MTTTGYGRPTTGRPYPGHVIVRYVQGQTLADREALTALLDRPASTIRARCEPVASDVETRRALYDADAVRIAMDGRQRRRPRITAKATTHEMISVLAQSGSL